MNYEEQRRDAKILIVDDQAANVKLLEKVLRGAGYREVQGCTDPREGVRLYEERRHDLVLLDIRMPHMDGFEFMRLLKEIEDDHYIPVLVLTAQIDRETRVRALEGGARDFLTKPFDRIEALSRIRNLLEVRLLNKQVRAQNQELEEKVSERTEDLHRSRLDIIQRLGRAAEFRDSETGQHIMRMSRLAEAIGRRAGVSKDGCRILLNACPMHDVGKIGIPDHILLKPGALTPEERTVMETHARIGADLLDGGDYPLMISAQSIALSHHEKWDGSGYPEGLAGEEIPLFGRIAALSDVFDALTSKRPYKEAWSVAKAAAFIEGQSGKHFDPELVRIFKESLSELLEIMAAFPDPE
ncbi:MAG: response regulator [Magnetococcales bacterium]|nr:response regulator [Magnetococcales bacterium]